MYRVPRTRSTQKLPMTSRRAAGEASSKRHQHGHPVAAETKFCTVSPSIWVR